MWRKAATLLCLLGCGSEVPPPIIPARGPPPYAHVVSLPPLDRDARCEGRLVLEIDHLVVRKYPRPELTPPFHFLPLVALVLSVPGGPDEGDITLVAGKPAYREGDRVRIFEGRVLLDRPIWRLHGLALEVHLAENHTTITPEWMTYTTIAGGAAGALNATTGGVIDVGGQIVRKLDHDDIMLTWVPPLEELIHAAQETPGSLHYRLLTPRVLPDGSPAAELEVLVRVERDATCR
jgi:hypothetical protein